MVKKIGTIKIAESLKNTIERGGFFIAVGSCFFAAQVYAEGIAADAATVSQIREGGALVLLALMLYLLVLKLIPGFLQTIREQAAEHSSALKALSEAINKQTVTLMSEMRAIANKTDRAE